MLYERLGSFWTMSLNTFQFPPDIKDIPVSTPMFTISLIGSIIYCSCKLSNKNALHLIEIFEQMIFLSNLASESELFRFRFLFNLYRSWTVTLSKKWFLWFLFILEKKLAYNKIERAASNTREKNRVGWSWVGIFPDSQIVAVIQSEKLYYSLSY